MQLRAICNRTACVGRWVGADERAFFIGEFYGAAPREFEDLARTLCLALRIAGAGIGQPARGGLNPAAWSS